MPPPTESNSIKGRKPYGLRGAGTYANHFAMLHFDRSSITELSRILGIHRVSFARLARSQSILGLKRTEKYRWKLVDRGRFLEFARRYREQASLRCYNLSKMQQDKRTQLEAGIRFHERFRDTDIVDRNRRELERMESAGIADNYTTTELARILGVTTQSVRNMRYQIPGAKLVGQRLRFEKSEKLERWIQAKRSLPDLIRRRRRKRSERLTPELPF